MKFIINCANNKSRQNYFVIKHLCDIYNRSARIYSQRKTQLYIGINKKQVCEYQNLTSGHLNLKQTFTYLFLNFLFNFGRAVHTQWCSGNNHLHTLLLHYRHLGNLLGTSQ